MDEGLRQIIALLAVAMTVAIAARRLKLPYTVGLVFVGAALASISKTLGPHLTHDLIFDLILPPLLFEAALAIQWRELKRDLAPILLFATLGSALSMAAVTALMMFALHWPLAPALVFGSLIAATDPVAIIAMFKDNRMEGRLRLLIESESLLNDGAAAVLFGLSLEWAISGGEGWTALGALFNLLQVVAGGVAVGALFGGVAILAVGRTSDHLVEASLTTIVAFGSFLTAEYLHASGVLATVIAGLIIGNLAVSSREESAFLTPKGREFVVSFWEFAAFLANSVVFLLIGEDAAELPFAAYGIGTLLAAAGIALLGRALTVYPLGLCFSASRWAFSLKELNVMWWGGLRGALSLALALALPPQLPLRQDIIVVTFGVVAFSIVAQGLTMPPLLRMLGKPSPP
ncbi:cation:proton antiporter [Methylocystis heyeri]|uniref:Sodium:proton antiporter n=1 Tax=Methylocystis heyeri TaxID=391905 RepID=A0A6B8KIY6_9HYPH|nr:sodium:proton antiporter [Methylocystis heyeri]QGM47459.1 sodium:proton antiporter [Methylocystis heyeri]